MCVCVCVWMCVHVPQLFLSVLTAQIPLFDEAVCNTYFANIISTSYKQNIIQYINIATQHNFKEAGVGFISIPNNVYNVMVQCLQYNLLRTGKYFCVCND